MAEDEFPIKEDDLDTVVVGLEWTMDRDGTGFAAASALHARIDNYLNPMPEEPQWRQGKTPFKMIAPDGKKFNLRVESEREEFLARLNGEQK